MKASSKSYTAVLHPVGYAPYMRQDEWLYKRDFELPEQSEECNRISKALGLKPVAPNFQGRVTLRYN